MKKNYLKLAVLAFLMGATFTLKAQEEITELVKAGADDMETLVKNYLDPFGKGLSAHLGNNWYNTAATHKILGFDITISGGVATVPEADKMFSITGTTFKKLQLVSGTSADAPTFSGPTNEGPELAIFSPATTTTFTDPNTGLSYPVNVPAQELARFKTPQGTDLGMVPSLPPSAQLCIGLPFGTEISGRFIPTIKASGFEAGLWGFAIKHNFKQWIPVVSELPFDASALFGYTKMSMSYAFGDKSIMPADLGDVRVISATPGFWGNQKFELGASAWTLDLIVSKKLLFFTPYIGVGYTSTKFNMAIKGNIPVAEAPITNASDPDYIAPGSFDPNTGSFVTNPEFLKPVVREKNALVDPIDFEIPNNMIHANIGFRLKVLWVLAFHAQYTLQKYPIISGGFGINIR